MAIAAKIPMMAMTIISSINVKPFSFLSNFLNISTSSFFFNLIFDQKLLPARRDRLNSLPHSPPSPLFVLEFILAILLPNLYGSSKNSITY
jgi:hypothetical protein